MKVQGRAWISATGAWLALMFTWSSSFAGEPPRPANKPSKTVSSKPAPKTAARPVHVADLAARRAISGGPLPDDATVGLDNADLRALREADRELFGPPPEGGWPSELVVPLPHAGEPQVFGSGLPPAVPVPPSPAEAAIDASWLTHLEVPDLPIRWDARVVQYIEFFRDDPRGRATFASLFRRSGRVRDMMRRSLRAKALPEDLVWVSMIESGFDPVARSYAGAVGLWQFMPETGRTYGLAIDRWIDQRYNPELATTAAADLLGDLHRRFGNWELALAAYNMGAAGLASVVRRYNTNDFWQLSRIEGSLPWETTLYVPKILAASVVAHNLAAFGLGDLAVDAPVDTELVDVPPGTALGLVAQAASCDIKEIEALNPELRTSHTPPPSEGDAAYPCRVPQGKGLAASRGLSRLRRDPAVLDRYVVRFGETIEQVAASHKTTVSKLVELNALAPGEALRGGTLLIVPAVDEPATKSEHVGPPVPGTPAAPPTPPGPASDLGNPPNAVPAKPTVIVPTESFAYPDRRRVFYRVLLGDGLKDVATALHVSVDDMRRWNDLDASARLQEGMTLQAFVPTDSDLSQVVVSSDSAVRVLVVGSDAFFASPDFSRYFKRVAVSAKAGDTVQSVGRRFNVSPRTMERINRRGRNDVLKPGETLVVYVPTSVVVPPASGQSSGALADNGASNGPLPEAPAPGLLP